MESSSDLECSVEAWSQSTMSGVTALMFACKVRQLELTVGREYRLAEHMAEQTNRSNSRFADQAIGHMVS